MKNGATERDRNAKEVQNEKNRPDKRKPETDFESLAKSYVATEFRNANALRRLVESVAEDRTGAKLLDFVAKKGEPGKVTGSAKKRFEEAVLASANPREAVRTIRNAVIRETVGKNLALSEQKKTLVRVVSSEFQLSEAEIRKIETAVRNQAPTDVAKPLSDSEQRENFVWIALGRPSVPPKKSSRMENLSKAGAAKPGETAEESEKRAEKIALWQKAILSGRLSSKQAREIIAEFQNPEDRKILAKALVPNSDLGTLVEKGFATREEAMASLRKTAEKDPLYRGLDDSRKREALAAIDLKEVPVSVDELPDAVVNGFVSEIALSGRLAAKLREEVNRGMRDAFEDIDGDFRVEADHEGKIAPNFLQETVRRLTRPSDGRGAAPGLEGLGLLATESFAKNGTAAYVEGECQTADGSKKATMKIGPWNEYVNGRKAVVVTFYEPDYGEIAGSRLELGYSEFYQLLSRFRSGKVMPHSEFAKIRREKRTDVENVDIHTEAPFSNANDLTDRLDMVDHEWAGLKVAPGLTFIVGKPGQANFNVGTVVGVDEGRKTVDVRNTRGTVETFGFAEFFLIFRDGIGAGQNNVRVRRMKGSASTVASVLELEKTGARWRDFGDLVVMPGEGSENGRIMSKNRQYETGYQGIRYFVGEDGKGVEVTGITSDGNVIMREIKDFKFPEKAKEGQFTGLGAARVYPPESFYYMLEKHGCQPYDVPKTAEIKPLEELPFKTNSFFKGIMHHANFNDIVKGMMRIPDVVKHRFEHSSKHHSAHVAMTVASKLPFFPKEWLVDFQREVYAEDKKMLEEDIEHLNSLNPPRERQKQIKTWLFDKASSHNEIIASICSMLEKHGCLYSGVLKEYEGKWLFFSRLPGNKAEKEAFRADLEKKYEGREITEEFVIHEWLKIKFEDLHLNPAYWKMVKDRWEKGASSEKENGAKEVQNWPTFGRRLKYVMDKLNDHEYAHAIGALEEVWNKPGPLKDRMKLPFLLALTNIRDGLHSTILQKFPAMFGAGHTYPPLLFIHDPIRQKLFRNVIRKLSRAGGYEDDFNAIAGLFGGAGVNNTLLNKAAEFWDKHGEDLTKKLLVNVSDPHVATHSDDSELAEYHGIVSGELDDSKFDDAELSMGTYGSDNANWAMLNAGKYVKLIKLQGGPGKLDGPLPGFLFDELVKTLDKIRHQKYDADTESDRKVKEALFRTIHFKLMKHLEDNLNSDWWKFDAESGTQKLYSHGWMAQLARMGFRISKTQNPSNFEGSAYETWLKNDFNRFMSEERSVPLVQENVARGAADILGRDPGSGTPPTAPASGPSAPGTPPSGNSGTPPAGRSGGTGPSAGAVPPSENAAPETAREPEVRTSAESVESPVPAVAEPAPEGEPVNLAPETEAEGEPRAEARTPTEEEVRFERVMDRYGAPSVAAYAERLGNIAKTALGKFNVAIPDDLRTGEWGYRTILKEFENSEREGTLPETLDDQNGFIEMEAVWEKIGFEAHNAYRITMGDEADRERFLNKITDPVRRATAMIILERVTDLDRQDFVQLGGILHRQK